MTALPTLKLTHWIRRTGPTRTWASVGSHLGERGEKNQFYRDPHSRQMRSFCCVPEAWQYWLFKKPSRQETAESVVHRYSLTSRLL